MSSFYKSTQYQMKPEYSPDMPSNDLESPKNQIVKEIIQVGDRIINNKDLSNFIVFEEFRFD